ATRPAYGSTAICRACAAPSTTRPTRHVLRRGQPGRRPFQGDVRRHVAGPRGRGRAAARGHGLPPALRPGTGLNWSAPTDTAAGVTANARPRRNLIMAEGNTIRARCGLCGRGLEVQAPPGITAACLFAVCPECGDAEILQEGRAIIRLRSEPEGSLFPLG